MSAGSQQELVALECKLATGGGEDCERILAEEATVVVPGATMDKAQTVEAMRQGQGWDGFSFDNPRRLEPSAGCAGLVYLFSGRRGGSTYRAVLTSLYVERNGRWRLIFHQQTPLQ